MASQCRDQFFHRPQCLCQHFFRDTIDPLERLTETHRAIFQCINNQGHLAADQFPRRARYRLRAFLPARWLFSSSVRQTEICGHLPQHHIDGCRAGMAATALTEHSAYPGYLIRRASAREHLGCYADPFRGRSDQSERRCLISTTTCMSHPEE